MTSARKARAHLGPRSDRRLLWITPDRVFYVGLLGVPTERTMGSLMVYVATEGLIHASIASGAWQSGEVVVVPPYTPHRVAADARTIQLVKLEAETVNLQHLPQLLRGSGAVAAPAFAERVRAVRHSLCDAGEDGVGGLSFDSLFFGEALPARALDTRIRRIVDVIKTHPTGTSAAEDCAELAHLSFSRFLHLFKDNTGVSFRSFRTWKRARALLHYVNRDTTLAHVALEAGYPDSTHFSHSIRQFYGLSPKDIFAGSRSLPVLTRHLGHA